MLLIWEVSEYWKCWERVSFMVKVLKITNLESIKIPYKSKYSVLNTGYRNSSTYHQEVLSVRWIWKQFCEDNICIFFPACHKYSAVLSAKFFKILIFKTCYTQTLLVSSVISSVYFEVLFIDFCLCNQTDFIPHRTSYYIHSQKVLS
jgi:hypothetical protein